MKFHRKECKPIPALSTVGVESPLNDLFEGTRDPKPVSSVMAEV